MQRIARCLALVLGLGLLSYSSVSAAPTLGVSPSSIAPDETGEVQVTLTGLLGANVVLRLYVDVDGDGTIAPEDYPVWTDVIGDNAAEWSPNMASDTDPASGAVTVDVRLFGPMGFPYAAGTFIWEAEDTFDASTDTAAFSVVQPIEAQSVAGIVTDDATSLPVPGALVFLEPFCDGGTEIMVFPSAFTDVNGAYQIEVPEDLDCNHRLVVAVKPGYVTSVLDQRHVAFTGSDTFTNQDVQLTLGLYEVDGRLEYETGPDTGQGVPGILMFAEGKDGPPVISVAYTDENGDFLFTLTDGSWYLESPEDGLDLQGAVTHDDAGVDFTVSGAPLTLADLLVPAANAFFEGTLYDDFGVPQAGAWVSAYRHWPCDPDCYGNEVLTRADGSFSLGVIGPASPATYGYSLSTPDPLPGLVAEQRHCENISDGETQTGRDLVHLTPTATITGAVRDKNGNGLENLCLFAQAPGPACVGYQSTVVTDCDGTYSLPVVDGDWNVRTEIDDLASLYRDLDDTQVDRNLTISGSGAGDVDFIVGRWSMSPTVTHLELPAGPMGSQVLVEGFGFSLGSTPQVFFDTTPASVLGYRPDLGGLIVEVPGSMSPGSSSVTVYNPDLDKTSEPLCYSITPGTWTPTCTISGKAIELNTFADVPGALVILLPDGGEEFVRAAVTDSSGDWSVALEDPGTYTVLYIPPEGQSWTWGFHPGTACDTTRNHAFSGGWTVTGRVTTDNGDGISGVSVEAGETGGSGYFSETFTDDDGRYTLVVPPGDYDFDFEPRPGSRFLASPDVVQSIGSDTDLGQTTLGRGHYFCGRAVDVDGVGLSAEVEAFRRSDGAWAGISQTHSCDGRFDVALPAGEFRLDLYPDGLETDGPTEVKWVDVSGDTVAEFDFTLFDRNALQLDGPEPRIRFLEQSPEMQVGQPVMVFAENVGGAVVELRFDDGAGGFVPGDDPAWDPDRGIVVGRFPAGAVGGDVRVASDGLESKGLPVTLVAGSYPGGAHTVGGKVTDVSLTPVPGVFVALFRTDPSPGDCGDDDDDGILHDYALTDASGDYALSHPGGDFELVFFPPAAGGLAQAAEEHLAVFSNLTVDRTLAAGLEVHLRAVDDATVPNPVPGALLEVDSDGCFDMRLTDANGDATLHVAPGNYDLELIPPVGSRLLEQEWQDAVSTDADYGDRTLTRGVLVGSRAAAETDGSPLVAAIVESQRDGDPYDFFFERYSATDGTFHGPVSSGAPFQLFVEPRDPFVADLNLNGLSVGTNDRILYPSFELGPAGFIEGYVRDALTSGPLADIGLHIHVDDAGSPGDGGSGWADSCPDGFYRMKVAAGTHYLHVNGWPPNAYLEEWYPDAYCGDDAVSVAVAAGQTVNADVDLDRPGSLSGSVRGDGVGLQDVNICVSGPAMGSCQVCNENTDAAGDYTLNVPPGADYRVEAYAFDYGNQCYDGEDGCVGFDPVTVTAGLDTPEIDFAFGCDGATDVFFDDMESGSAGWTMDGLWHLGSDPACSPAARSGSTSWHYNSGSCDFDTGGANLGLLRTPVMSSVPAGATLSYWYRRETDGNCSITDRSKVLVWVNGGGPFEVWDECDNSNGWFFRRLDLTPYYSPGDDLQLGFEFDSVDDLNNGFLGWMIDDVRVFTCPPPDEPSATGSGRPLQLVGGGSNSLVVEKAVGASAYNVYVDALGSFYSPSFDEGTTCTVTWWNDNGDGTVTLDVTLPPNTWVVVTASNASGESSAGADSFGNPRRSQGSWESCALGP